MLEQVVPEVLDPVEGTYIVVVWGGLLLRRWTHAGEVHEELSPVSGFP